MVQSLVSGELGRDPPHTGGGVEGLRVGQQAMAEIMLPGVAGWAVPQRIVPCKCKGVQPALKQGTEQLPLSAVTHSDCSLDAKLKRFVLWQALFEGR